MGVRITGPLEKGRSDLPCYGQTGQTRRHNADQHGRQNLGRPVSRASERMCTKDRIQRQQQDRHERNDRLKTLIGFSPSPFSVSASCH